MEKLLSKPLHSFRAVIFAVVVVLVLGWMSYRSLRVDLFPALNFPTLNVLVEIPSFSSVEMERQVTLPIESAVGGVMGVTRVRSTSATGISMISADFEWGTDVVLARQLLLDALASIRAQMPPESEPTIENLSATLSMIEGYSLQGGDDPVKLRDSAVYDLKPRLQRIPGVYKVVVMGGKILEYAVHPNPYLMLKYDVTLDNLKDSLSANNILASPGVVNKDEQELVLHANGQFADEEEIGNTVVAVKSGIPIHVHDLGKVSKAFQYERGDTSERGSSAILINVLKQPNFDTGQVARGVRDAIDRYQMTLSPGFTIRNYYDQAQLVEDSIGSVKESVWIGGLLVVIVLAFFLHSIRSTLIAAMSIPISVMAAIVLMRVFGVGLNVMSLGGLAIGTGIIVDDTIVVLENIFRWLYSPELRGEDPVSVTIFRATREVIRPVVVSTFTNIGIFLPMVLVEGFAGRLFSPVSLTVTFALLASLVVAVTVIPAVSLKWLADGKQMEDKHDAAYILFYQRILKVALRHPKRVLIGALVPVLLVGFGFKHLETEFLPALDEGAVLLQTIMPPGTSLPESKRLNQKIENWVKTLPGVETVVRRTGHAPGAEDTDNVNHSDITVKLVPKSKRPISLDGWIAALKAKTSDQPSVIVNYLMPLADKINDALGGVPADIGVDFFGPDLEQLHGLAENLVKKMAQIKGVTDLRPPTDFPVPSLEVEIDKKEAGHLGILTRNIQDTLEAFTHGIVATQVKELQKQINVTIHLAQAGENVDLESLQSLPLKTSGGNNVPLEQVAKVGYGEIPSEINHEHLSRKLTVTANVQGRSANDVAKNIEAAIRELQLPTGYSWDFSGKYQSEQSAQKNIGMVLILAILVVSIILWLEFRSWVEVGLILITIPLAAIGAVLSLWFFHQTVNVSSMIGAIMLVGIVVRNGIMLLDYLNLYRETGASLEESIMVAASRRVRPILMTATVTILGLLPLAMGWGTGAELQKPLAIAVIGGLVTSTILTLVVLPSAARIVMARK